MMSSAFRETASPLRRRYSPARAMRSATGLDRNSATKAGTAQQAARRLVVVVVGAQQVAVREQGGDAVEVDDGLLRQQGQAGLRGEALADQEVAVAALKSDGHAAARQLPQGVPYRRRRGVVVVVADPGVEQVAEDVYDLGLPRPHPGEADEQLHRLRALRREVQVGDEEGFRHARVVPGGWRNIGLKPVLGPSKGPTHQSTPRRPFVGRASARRCCRLSCRAEARPTGATTSPTYGPTDRQAQRQARPT